MAGTSVDIQTRHIDDLIAFEFWHHDYLAAPRLTTSSYFYFSADEITSQPALWNDGNRAETVVGAVFCL
jgi:hypothetical protein